MGSVGCSRNALMFYKENYALTLTLILAYSAMTLSTVPSSHCAGYHWPEQCRQGKVRVQHSQLLSQVRIN